MLTFDEHQLEAIRHDDGPLLILAGAGAGKTAVVTERTARMIGHGVDPATILQLTFSRKAAREMYGRLYHRMGQPSRSRMPTIQNFHAFGWALIRQHPKRCGFRGPVTLLSEADQKAMLFKSLSSQEVSDDRRILSKVMTLYDISANEGLTRLLRDEHHKEECNARFFKLMERLGLSRNEKIIAAIRDYIKAKQKQNVVDYGDLLTLPLSVMDADPDWVAEVAPYRYIVVDEAQDTNVVQYQLVRRMAPHGNLVMVGDDDQCIYEWRGAHPGNLQQFVQDYNAKIVRLERNYRSTPSIVSLAANLIEHNVNRIEKRPYSSRVHPGEDPVLHHHEDGQSMADAIARSIREKLDQGVPAHHIAVLYRIHRMTRILEPVLNAYGIPYHIVKGHEVFDRHEARMLMAAVRFIHNPYDEAALHTLMALVPGVGDKTFVKMVEEASFRNRPPLEGRTWLPDKARAALDDLALRLERLALFRPELVVEWAMDEEGGNFDRWIRERVKRADDPEGAYARRMRALEVLDTAIRARIKHSGATTREEQWAEVLAMSADSPDDDGESSVTLATIFQVKGLEFSHVLIAGYSGQLNEFHEGIMPLRRAYKPHHDRLFEDEEDIAASLEEERRLAYVAFTR
ncbi:MAG: ATP-dependent helicase, partial [Halothiobacillaceae bacterium]